MQKDQLFKTSGLQFNNYLFGPEKFSGLSRNGPLGPLFIRPSFGNSTRKRNNSVTVPIAPVPVVFAPVSNIKTHGNRLTVFNHQRGTAA